jgi:hypothetical protein
MSETTEAKSNREAWTRANEAHQAAVRAWDGAGPTKMDRSMAQRYGATPAFFEKVSEERAARAEVERLEAEADKAFAAYLATCPSVGW